jgi:ParB family transcriptional regulator, chromosome partitioning protein
VERERKIRMVPIAAIKLLNSRGRNRERFDELTTSIAHLGLKRPITVGNEEGTYDLACGEGRLRAFEALGQTEIPAVVLAASSEDCILMGLIENFARRRHTPLELVEDIGRLRRVYGVTEIAAKLDLSPEYVKALCYLLKHGEDRLLSAVDRGVIPPTLAIEIAKAKTPQLQGALLESYVNERHTTGQIKMMRKLVEQRVRNATKEQAKHQAVDPAALVRVYRKETDRQKAVSQKAELAHARLIFIVNALKTLSGERMFASLLRREGLDKIPLPIWQRMSSRVESSHEAQSSQSVVRV